MPATPFTLGDHQFITPDQTGDPERFAREKRQILGAPPPAILEGIAREATPDSVAAGALYLGEFCGHGEPTMTIFDVIIDDTAMVEVGAVLDPEDPEMEENLPIIAVRKPGATDWIAIFRREWEEQQETLVGKQRAILTPEEAALIDPEQVAEAHVSIGFEYPEDATSRDEVSWMTIDAFFEGEPEPVCIADAELA